MYADVTIPAEANPGGTSINAFFIPVADIATYGTITTPVVNPGDAITISGNHVPVSGKRFYKVQIEVNKGELAGEFQGDVLGGISRKEFTGFVSGASANAIAVLEKAKRENLLFFVELPDGKVLQLGTNKVPARLRTGFQTGTNEGGERGTNVTVHSYQDTLFYKGTLPLTNQV